MIATIIGAVEAPTTVDDYGSVAGAIVAGAFVFLVWAHVIGAVRWGLRRAWRKPGTYAQTTYSWGVMVTAVVLMFFAAVGRGAQILDQEEEATKAAPAKVSNDPTERARQAYVEWFDGFADCLPTRADGFKEYDRFIKALEKDNGAALEYLDAMELKFTRFSDCVAKETLTTDPKLDAISQDLIRSGEAAASSAGPYREGLAGDYDIKLLAKGDARINRSQRLVRAAGRAGDQRYQDLGGAEAFKGRIDFDRIIALMREK